jgi:hypothetical protein
MLHDGRADVPHLRNLTLRRSIIPENDTEFRAYDLTLRRSIIPENDTESSALTQSSITQRTLYTIIILTT